MPLIKQMQINSVLTAEFHKVLGYNYDEPTTGLSLSLASYVNEASKLAGDNPVHTHGLQLNNVDPITSDPIPAIEALLISDPTVFPVLVSEEEPAEYETNEEGDLIKTKEKVEAVYKSFFAD